MKTNYTIKTILLLLTIVSFQSCKKNETKVDSADNALGLTFASSNEISGVPVTPEFLIESLPSSIMLDMPPVGNQGSQGSCVSWSTAYAGMGYFMNRFNGTHYGSSKELCSPKYIYNQISQGACSGTSIPANLTLLQNKGVCTLNDMPYNDYECRLQPNSTQNAIAAGNKLFAWRMVDKNNINVLKSCLAAKYPIFIAVNVDASFINLQSPFIWSSKSGASKGGHAITVVGYDDSKHAFKIQNSWGENWKDNGHMWISYDFFSQAVVGQECYIAFPQITSPNDNINLGMVVNMPFNGNANDVSGNNNNGTVSGANLTSDRNGNLNSAYKFNGLSSPGSITINNSVSLNNLTSYSICLWTKFDSYSGDNGTGTNSADGINQISWQTILYRGGSTNSQFNTAFKFLLSSQSNIFGIFLGSGTGGQTSGAYSKLNEWHHYVISKQGNILKMFKDGILIWDLQNSFAKLSDANGFSFVLGKALLPGNGVPFSGILDDLRIYNRPLTASEVQKIYKL